MTILIRGIKMKLIDRTGHRYERLVVLERAPNANQRDTNARWLCRCNCGKTTIAYGQDLARGKIKSCGCLNAERITKHGRSRTRVYDIWKQMWQRCENPKCSSFGNYGGRGITVCEEWRDFAQFFADMGDPPPRRTLERCDNSKGYSKANCRWATRSDQLNNTRVNHVLEFDGMRMTIAKWSERTGLKVSTIHSRIQYGWPVWRTLTEPVNSRKGT
jgi:hypothetical protein